MACIFPGQGIKIHYNQNIFQTHYAKECINQINEVIGYDISSANQSLTANSQLSILLISHLLYREYCSSYGQAKYVAGHSLGQYSAAIASGALSFEQAVNIVYHRSVYMDQDVQKHSGKMVACIGDNVSQLLNNILPYYQDLCIANYNSSKQVVVSGVFDVSDFSKNVGKYGIKCIPLKVAGAFHSKFMIDSNQKMNKIINSTNFTHPTSIFILNKTKNPTNSALDIKNDFIDQITSPVNFTQTIQLIEELASNIVEVNTTLLLGKFFNVPVTTCYANM